MKLLNKDEILNASDLQTKTVKVPEWGGSVNIRTMTGIERDGFERELLDDRKRVKQKSLRAWLCSLCIVDDKNKCIFTAEDVAKLAEKSSVALDRVFSAAMKLNRIGQQEIEDVEKNFDDVQGEDSASD